MFMCITFVSSVLNLVYSGQQLLSYTPNPTKVFLILILNLTPFPILEICQFDKVAN